METRTEVLARTLQAAAKHFDAGSYQACAAESQDIITTGARLAAEMAQQTIEQDALRQEIQAQCAGLKEYMARCRQVTFVDDLAREEVTEDLDAFSQGRYAKVQGEIDSFMERLEKGDWTVAELTLMQEELNTVLAPNAELVCETARDQLLAYYERLHTMEKLADYMRTQNYELEWACHPGDDQTQKLTVRFVDRTANNSVVLSLDRDMSTEDIHRMVMDLHLFYQNGRPMTEQEKQTFRAGITAALAGSDVQANLGCTGNKDRPSDQTHLLNEDTVRSAAPVQLFQDGE